MKKRMFGFYSCRFCLKKHFSLSKVSLCDAQISFKSFAIRQASIEFLTCYFPKISCLYRLTVFRLMENVSAMSLLVR